jgi:hypothetical protein
MQTCFNKHYLYKKTGSNYAKIEIPNTSPIIQHTSKEIMILRIKDKAKYFTLQKKYWILNYEVIIRN